MPEAKRMTITIAEACHYGTIRPVPAKTVEQQDEAKFTRIRQQLVQDRT